jgi:hypothetical protein
MREEKKSRGRDGIDERGSMGWDGMTREELFPDPLGFGDPAGLGSEIARL